MHEPKAKKSFGSLLDPASGCSAPRGQKHQMNCVSSSPTLEEAKLSLNDQKHLFHFWMGLRKHLCPFISLPSIAYEEQKPRCLYMGSSGQLAQIQRCFILCKMHQAYQPILPCGNKYLQLKWDKAKYEEHKKRSLPEMERFKYEVQAAKPLVDTSTPAIYSHLHLKFGKLKLEEDRLSIIKRNNRLLLEKVSCIMRAKGQIDNKNDYKAKSLNGEKRKQELRRVNQENRAILDRITKSQPRYQVQRWHEDWQRAEKYMANIARYPRGRCKSQSRKEEQFEKKTSQQDRRREKQLKEEGMKSKMKEKEREHAHHGKGKNN